MSSVSKQELRRLASLPILDRHGKEQSYGSLWQVQRVAMIFVRHFG